MGVRMEGFLGTPLDPLFAKSQLQPWFLLSPSGLEKFNSQQSIQIGTQSIKRSNKLEFDKKLVDICNLGGRVFDLFRWTNGRPYKRKLMKFDPKL